LRELGREDVAVLLRSMFGVKDVPKPFLDRVVAAGRGNPLYVEEMLKLLVSRGDLRWAGNRWAFPEGRTQAPVPETLEGTFEGLLGGVEDRDRGVLEAAAVWGGPAGTATLAILGEGLSRESVAESLRRLLARSLVERIDRAEGWGWRIRPSLFLAFVLSRIDKLKRPSYHSRAAALLGSKLGFADRHPEPLARHLLLAQEMEKGIPLAIKAASGLTDLFQYERANEILGIALAGTEPDQEKVRAGILFTMGRNQVMAGDVSKALAAFRQAEEILDRLDGGEGADLLGMLLQTASLLQLRNQTREAFDLFDRCERIAVEAGDSKMIAGVRLSRGSSLVYMGRHAEGREQLEAVFVEDPSLQRTWPGAQSCIALGSALTIAGEFDRAGELLTLAEEFFREQGSKFFLESTFRFRGLLEQELGRIDRALHLYEEAFRISREIGGRKKQLFSLEPLISLHLTLGQYPEADVLLKEGLEIARIMDDRVGEMRLLSSLSELCAGRGEFATAKDIGESVVRFFKEARNELMPFIARASMASIAVTAGNLAQSVALIRNVRNHYRRIGDRHRLGFILHTLGRHYLKRGKLSAALRILSGPPFSAPKGISGMLMQEVRVSRAQALYRLGRSLKAQEISASGACGPAPKRLETGVRLRDQGKFDEAQAFFSALVERSLGRASPFEEMGALSELGETQRCRGSFDEAFSSLHRAHSLNQGIQAPYEGVEVLLRLSDVVERLGDTDRARTLSDEALAQSPSAHSLALKGRAWLRRGDLEAVAGAREEGERCIGKALGLFRRTGEARDLCAGLLSLASLQRGEDRAVPLMAEAGKILELAASTDLEARLTRLESSSTLRRRTDEVSPGPAPSRDADGREVRTLRAILKVCKRFNTERRLPDLLDLILDSAMSIFEAKRGFILLDTDEGLRSLVSRNVLKEDRRETSFSTTIARDVFESGQGIRFDDALKDTKIEQSRSIHDLALKSVLCAPMRSPRGPIGALYLDHPKKIRAFEKEDLDLLGALSDLAGIAVEDARLHERLIEGEQKLLARNVHLEEEMHTRLIELSEVREQLLVREKELRGRDIYSDIVAQSEAMQKLFDLLDRVTESTLPVVIEGETGTGKELVARAIHYNSVRKSENFVSLNCAALPENLLESELFGYKKGAFTGAVKESKGLFVHAHLGTLFLDEIGDMSPPLQAKLLRALQEGEVRPVGGKESIPVDVRIICATNRNLAAMVSRGEFREDLFFRLNVLHLTLPPLRKREEDIPLLAVHFLSLFLKKEGKAPDEKVLSPSALKALGRHLWPGNVRELKNTVERAAVFSRTHRITGGDIVFLSGEGALAPEEGPLDFKESKIHFEREYLTAVLKRHIGNITKAAKEAGVERGYFHRLLKKHGIVARDFKAKQ
jgi:transcriptional regulator with GAF, ATPase, and Fis domain/tetratricopeptide (TPR) repeat protein